MLICPDCQTRSADNATSCAQCSRPLSATDFIADSASPEQIEAHLEQRRAAALEPVAAPTPVRRPRVNPDPRERTRPVARGAGVGGTASRPPPSPGADSVVAERQTAMFIGLGAGAGMIFGSLMPWATLGAISFNGTEGDGVITLALGIAVAVLFLVWGRGASEAGWPLALALLASLAVLGIAVYDGRSVADLAGLEQSALFQVRVGTGLDLTGLSGAVGAVTAGRSLLRDLE